MMKLPDLCRVPRSLTEDSNASGANRVVVSPMSQTTVCVVDDDDSHRDSLKLLLESADLNVVKEPKAFQMKKKAVDS